MPFPALPAEVPFEDTEIDLADSEPPGLLPLGQDSYWGQLRRIHADQLQIFADQLAQWYLNADPRTVDATDMAMWEVLEQIPVVTTKPLEARRAFVLSRRVRGAFTRTRRKNIVEAFITATFGAAPRFSPEGIPIDSDGIPLFSDFTSIDGTYEIIEDIPAFSYTVYILDTITVDTVGLTRELERITTSPITFTISSVSSLP